MKIFKYILGAILVSILYAFIVKLNFVSVFEDTSIFDFLEDNNYRDYFTLLLTVGIAYLCMNIVNKLKNNKISIYYTTSSRCLFGLHSTIATLCVNQFTDYHIISTLDSTCFWLIFSFLILFTLWCTVNKIKLWWKKKKYETLFYWIISLYTIASSGYLIYCISHINLFLKIILAASISIALISTLELNIYIKSCYKRIIRSVKKICTHKNNKEKVQIKGNVEEAKTTEQQSYILPDDPITNSEEDLLGFSNQIRGIANQIKLLDINHSYRLGITASWGSGKSSFINLLKNKLNEDGHITMTFNPRHSKNASTIQSDFFQFLCNELKAYNNDFSSTIRSYMRAMLISYNRKFTDIFDCLQRSNKTNEKELLDNAFRKLPGKVIVMIEDLDRLTGEEIIEVFKLMEGNASFSNIIFVVGFDKEYVSQVLSYKLTGHNISEGQDNMNSYCDKYFNWVFELPEIDRGKLTKKLINKLNQIEFKNQNYIFRNDPYNLDTIYEKRILEEKVVNLRALKSFLNFFSMRLERVKMSVDYYDFFILSYLSYFYKEEYNILVEDLINISNNNNHTNKLLVLHLEKEILLQKRETPLVSKDFNILLVQLFDISNEGQGHHKKRENDKKIRYTENIRPYIFNKEYYRLNDEILFIKINKELFIKLNSDNYILANKRTYEELSDINNFVSESLTYKSFTNKQTFKNCVKWLFILSTYQDFRKFKFDIKINFDFSLIIELFSKATVKYVIKEYNFDKNEYLNFIKELFYREGFYAPSTLIEYIIKDYIFTADEDTKENYSMLYQIDFIEIAMNNFNSIKNDLVSISKKPELEKSIILAARAFQACISKKTVINNRIKEQRNRDVFHIDNTICKSVVKELKGGRKRFRSQINRYLIAEFSYYITKPWLSKNSNKYLYQETRITNELYDLIQQSMKDCGFNSFLEVYNLNRRQPFILRFESPAEYFSFDNLLKNKFEYQYAKLNIQISQEISHLKRKIDRDKIIKQILNFKKIDSRVIKELEEDYGIIKYF